MPWEHCGSTHLDNEACPSCGLTKEAWTVEFELTRQFTVKRRRLIRFELLLPDGEPVSEEPYRVELPDGSVVEECLDESGFAKIQLDAGLSCVITFPDRQANQVRLLPVEDDSAEDDSAEEDSPEEDSAEEDSSEEDSAEESDPETSEEGEDLAQFSCSQRSSKYRFRLQVGPVRVVIPASAFPGAGAFPGPGVFAHLRALAAAEPDRPGFRLLVAGLDAGDDLGQRRAHALCALLGGDVEAFEEHAGTSDGPVVWFQAMLHAIGCNPGATDDDAGEFTSESLRCFQREYTQGLYHRSDAAPAVSNLTESGELDADTRRAAIDAYLQAAPRVSTEQVNEPEEPLGDVELGETVPEPTVCLLLWQPEGEEAQDPAPVLALAEELKVPWIFGCQWRRQEEDGVVQLSALTSLPDGADCRFRVKRLADDEDPPAPPPDSANAEGPAELGTDLSEVEGTIQAGVCVAKWTRDEDVEDPFERLGWFAQIDDPDEEIDIYADLERQEPADPEDLDPEDFEIYEAHWAGLYADDSEQDEAQEGEEEEAGLGQLVFCVESGEEWAFSAPPGISLERLRFGEIAAKGLALRDDGTFVRFVVTDGRVEGEEKEAFVTAILSLLVDLDEDAQGQEEAA